MTSPATAESDAPLSRRSRSRRNVIGSSVHREDYVALMRAGWSSESISRYAGFRFGEDIPASTIRYYRNRNKVRAATAPAFPALQGGQGKGSDPEKRLDVMGLRAEAIQLQLARIRVEVAAEQDLKRLLPTVRDELRLLNTLLSDHKADQQDWGLAPKAGDRVDPPSVLPGVPAPAAGAVPKYDTLADMFQVPPGSDAERDIAVRLHLATRDGQAVAG